MESFVEAFPVKSGEAVLYGRTTNGIGCILKCKEDVRHLQKRGHLTGRLHCDCGLLSLLKGILRASLKRQVS